MSKQVKTVHRKKRKTYNIKGHAHELTFSCYHQYNYLNDPRSCELFLDELSTARKQYNFYLWAYVLMPNHVHLLLYPYKEHYNISIILQSIKGKMSTNYRNFLVKNNPTLFKKMCIQTGKRKVFRFWQVGGGYDRNLWTAKAVHASIKYVEANPVRKELVKRPEDWKWSSARAREYQEGLMPDDFDIPFLMK